MKRFIGIIFMLLGTALIIGALILHQSNRKEAEEAQESVHRLLPQLMTMIPDEPDSDAVDALLVPPQLLKPVDLKMTEVEIDGLAYIGYLQIPALELELPILSEWSDHLLRKAPCRYHGTLRGEDLVIMAHNYVYHFGKLSRLSVGDQVIFTDIDGIVTVFEVVARDILPWDAVEEMTAGEYDLTLFTCTYSGTNRITVFCDRVKTNSQP